MSPSVFSGRRIALLALFWFAGLYLRIPILVAPPLAPSIGADLGLGAAGIGALTTLPVLMLAVGALPGSLVIARLGPRRALIAALLLAGAASAARGAAPPAAVLFTATALMGLGIAIMQPALPALVARWCSGFTALAVAVYMNGMLLGEFVGAGLTLPLVMPLAGGDWRLALLFWSLPAAAVAAALLLPRDTGDHGGEPPAWRPAWGDGRMWRLGLLLGASSVVFFGTNAYMAEILEARGEGDRLSLTLFWFNLSQAVASLALIALARRLVGHRAPILVSQLAGIAGLAGFLWLAGDAALAAAFALGFAAAAQLILLVAMAPHVAPPEQTGSLSAGMFAIGYSVAFVVPLVGGLVADRTGSAAAALWPPLLYAAATVPLALGLGTRRSGA